MAKEKTKKPPNVDWEFGPRDLGLQCLKVFGKKVASMEFIDLPSVNTFYNMYRHNKGRVTAEWRFEAKEKAWDEMGFEWEFPFIKKRALVVVNVFIPHEGIMDIHNVYIKALLDGMSDAGMWADDEWAWVPLVLFRWAGVTQYEKREKRYRRTVIDVYEVDGLWVDGDMQILPRGRVKHAK